MQEKFIEEKVVKRQEKQGNQCEIKVGQPSSRSPVFSRCFPSPVVFVAHTGSSALEIPNGV